MGERQALVPRLRFPEFREAGEWQENQLTEIASLHKGKGISKADIKATGSQPCIRYGELYTVYGDVISDVFSKTDVPSDDLFMSREGDVIIPSSGETKIDIATAACVLQDNIALGSDLNVIRSEQNGVFLSYYLNGSLKHEIAKVAQGDTVVHLYKSNLEALKVAIPRMKEQQKIADCLSSLDALITAQADKIDALKTHKKGLMQQLFPREGETVPRLRFPEFQDVGEWDTSPLGEKVDLLSGFPFKSADISDNPDGIPLMRGINITEGFVRHTSDIDRYFLGNDKSLEKYKLQENDLFIGMDGSKVGKNSALITHDDAGSLLIQRVARLRAKCEATIRYIFQHIHSFKFHSYVDRINTSGGIPHISAKQINEFEICFPPVEEEQQKIADCLSSLDTLIAAHTEKLDTLKAHKKGLMQNLFPSPEAIGV